MLLGFKTQIKGRPTGFVDKILACACIARGVTHAMPMPPIATPRPKIHTIRDDQYKRWKPGMTIHFATGIRTKQYCQFGVGICKSVQSITIHANPMGIFMIQVDGWVLSNLECVKLSLDDGFDQFSDFESWFGNDVIDAGGSKTYRLIHWTDLKY